MVKKTHSQVFEVSGLAKTQGNWDHWLSAKRCTGKGFATMVPKKVEMSEMRWKMN